MAKPFGEILRELRLEMNVGLRELARSVDKSAGYLSDVENGRVPPPSEGVILKIASALGTGKDTLMAAAKKMDPELSEYMAEQPRAADFLRMTKEAGFVQDDWERLTQLAKLAKLGKGEEEKK